MERKLALAVAGEERRWWWRGNSSSVVERTLSEKKLTLSAAPVGLIGLDPSQSVGGAFELEGYPTLMIIDQKGIVQSVHVGYDPNSRHTTQQITREGHRNAPGRQTFGDGQ